MAKLAQPKRTGGVEGEALRKKTNQALAPPEHQAGAAERDELPSKR